MHFKEFPKTRVCGIDFYPYFLEALKESYAFCKKYKSLIVLNLKTFKNFSIIIV
jgi:hypothetical protein